MRATSISPLGVAMRVTASRQIGHPPGRGLRDRSEIVPASEIVPITVVSGWLLAAEMDSAKS